MTLTLVILLALSGLLVGMGLVVARKVSTSGDFFVAGRRLGPGLLAGTVLAANIGAGSTVGAASLGYRYGISAWWWVGSAAVGTAVLGWLVGPRIWRLARDHDFYTVGDFLEWRYGPSIRLGIAALLWLGTLAILAGQLLALAAMLTSAAEIPRTVSIVLGGFVIVAYFGAGGLIGAVWVNLVQLAVLLAAFALAVPMVLAGHGGVGEFFVAARDAGPGFTDFLSDRGGPWWSYLVLLAPAFIVSPGLIQKAYGARDERAIRVGIGTAAVFMLIFAFAPALLGMEARLTHPGLPVDDLALPTLLVSDLPLLLGLTGLAALFVADLSSADAILFMLSTSLTRDLYGRFIRPSSDDRELLRVARIVAVGAGAAGVLLALTLDSVISSLRIFYSLMTVSLFVPLLAGLYLKRVGQFEAWAAVLGGGLTLAVLSQASAGRMISWLTPTLAGVLAGALGMLLMVGLRGRRSR